MLAALALALVPAAAAQEAPPSFVVVLADDLGWGELGCYGQERIRTPHVDRLAREGTRFRRHYAGAPVCAPSRCVLLTGRHSGRAAIRDNLEVQPEGQTPLPEGERTLAEVLRDAGYATGCFGKWGLGPPGSEGDPLRQGFDRFFGYNCQRQAHNFYPRYLWSDDGRVPLEGNDRGLTGARYSHDLVEREALAFVREHRDRPFLCFVAATLPHLALQVPEDRLAEYRGAWDETPYEGGSYLPHPTPRAAYAAMVTRLDATVGRILDLLDELGIAERTLVLFTSDNGPTHLAQVDTAFFASTGGLRGRKGSVYEGGLRVPLVARWPGRVPPGRIRDHVCGAQDLLPTLAELAGAALPEGVDGVSFAPTLLGRTGEQRAHEHLVWDYPGYGGQLAVLLEGRWKGVRRGVRADPDAPLALYDLDADPAESTDLAVRLPDVVRRLEAVLARERTRPAVAAFRFGTYAE